MLIVILLRFFKVFSYFRYVVTFCVTFRFKNLWHDLIRRNRLRKFFYLFLLYCDNFIGILFSRRIISLLKFFVNLIAQLVSLMKLLR